jgi:hypothetical protein
MATRDSLSSNLGMVSLVSTRRRCVDLRPVLDFLQTTSGPLNAAIHSVQYAIKVLPRRSMLRGVKLGLSS